MTKQTRDLAEQAAKLTPSERIALVEEILASVPTDDAAWKAAWAKEAADRTAAYDRGEMVAADSEDVLAKLKTKYPEE